MSNFVKLSQPLSISPTQQQFLGQQSQTARSQDSLSKFKSISSDPYSEAWAKITNFAAAQGISAERIMRELDERDPIIRSMLVKGLDEDSVARYFDEFLFKKSIPWSKTKQIFHEALNSSNLPYISLATALDFALEHYDQKADILLTLEIMKKIRDLQPSMPEIRLYPVVIDALKGRYSSVEFYELSEKNELQALLIQNLIGLAYKMPGSDLETFRVQFRKNQDKLERLREIDDRYKAIFGALLEDEFNRTMTRVTQFLTNLFQLSANDPKILAVQRILVGLKMGQAARKQFFSPLEQRKISTFEPDEVSSKPKSIFNSIDDNRFVKVAAEVSKVPEQKIVTLNAEKNEKLVFLMQKILTFVNALESGYLEIKKNPAKYNYNPTRRSVSGPIQETSLDKALKILSNVKIQINETITALKRNQLTANAFIYSYYSIVRNLLSLQSINFEN